LGAERRVSHEQRSAGRVSCVARRMSCLGDEPAAIVVTYRCLALATSLPPSPLLTVSHRCFSQKFANVLRWRRACEHDSTGKPCPWKWQLEKRAKKCAWPLCARHKKNHWNHKLEDPLEQQARQPQTLNPKPQTLNPKPQTLNPKPQTLNPKPQTLNPKPQTLNSKSILGAPGSCQA